MVESRECYSCNGGDGRSGSCRSGRVWLPHEALFFVEWGRKYLEGLPLLPNSLITQHGHARNRRSRRRCTRLDTLGYHASMYLSRSKFRVRLP